MWLILIVFILIISAAILLYMFYIKKPAPKPSAPPPQPSSPLQPKPSAPPLQQKPSADPLDELNQATTVEAAIQAINAGADINGISESTKFTPLIYAIMNKKWEIAKLLIERGADVNLAHEPWLNPLDYAESLDKLTAAEEEEKRKLIELLKSKGAKLFK